MYTEFFGFKEKPFNVTPDPRYLYLSPSHQEALATMLYGIQERRGFVSIIGEIGTGKTTLLHTLFNELSNDVKTVFIFNTKINFKQLLQNILIELELTPAGNNKVLLLNQLNDFLIKILSLNENVALIIDEAQNLSSSVLEELRMLSNLETSKEKLLQIVLVGQPELDFKLRSHNLRQLKQRIGINCYLTPLKHMKIRKNIFIIDLILQRPMMILTSFPMTHWNLFASTQKEFQELLTFSAIMLYSQPTVRKSTESIRHYERSYF